MSVTLSLTGTKELRDALRRVGAEAEREVLDAVRVTAQMVRSNAQKSIARGTKSGAYYDKTNPRRTHRASGPGEAPASDTGRLIGSIRADVSGKSASVIADTVYAAALEFGTSKIAARPFMIPAMEAERPAWDRRLRAVIDKAAKKGGR
jgi:HK97 gp10 family phage protein